jgi:hypothetical protein
MRPFPGAACDENTNAKVAASRKVPDATALNGFMVLLFLLCASVYGFSFLSKTTPTRS